MLSGNNFLCISHDLIALLQRRNSVMLYEYGYSLTERALLFSGSNPTPHSVVWPHLSSSVQESTEKGDEKTGQGTEIAWYVERAFFCTWLVQQEISSREQRDKFSVVWSDHMWRLPVLGKHHHNSLMFHCQIKWKVWQKGTKQFCTLK